MSLLGTVAVIYFLGFTLNTFTLLGLALAVPVALQALRLQQAAVFIEADGAGGEVEFLRQLADGVGGGLPCGRA